MTPVEGGGVEEGWPRGLFQMTDECGCHGDSANEAAARVWQMAVNHTQKKNKRHGDLLFKYHFVFITQT